MRSWVVMGAALAAACANGVAGEPTSRHVEAVMVSAPLALAAPEAVDAWGPGSLAVATRAGYLMFSPSWAGRPERWVMVQQRDASGALVPGSFRALAPTYGIADRPAAAAAYGTGAWLVWNGRGVRDVPDGSVLGLRVDHAGRPLDAAPVVIHRATAGVHSDPRLFACTASQCLLVINNGGVSTVGVRLSADGRVLDTPPIPLPRVLSLVTIGDRYYVTWEATPPGGAPDVFVGRIGTDGALLDPGGRPVSAIGGARTYPTLATDGARLFVSFYATASGARLAGRYQLLLDAALNPLSAAHHVAASGTDVVALWTGSRWQFIQFDRGLLTRYDASGAALDATPRVIFLPESARPFTPLPAPGGFFVPGTPPGSRQAALVRFDEDGAPAGSPQPTPAYFRQDARPRAGSDGGGFVVGWSRGPIEGDVSHSTALVRVTSAGAVRDAPPVRATYASLSSVALEGDVAHAFGWRPSTGAGRAPVSFATRVEGAFDRYGTDAERPSAVAGPGQRLVFISGEDTFDGARPGRVFRYSASWARLDPGPVVLPYAPSLSAVFDGTNYLHAYGAVSAGAIYNAVRRLSPEGDFVDLTPRVLTALDPVAAGPRLTRGAGTSLLTWVDTSQRVKAVRLGADGAPLGPGPVVLGVTAGVPFLTSDDRGRELSTTFNGTNFVTVWTSGADRALRAARLSPAGALLDAAPIALATDGPAGRLGSSFDTASDARGNTLVAYELFHFDIGGQQIRAVFLRDDGATFPDAGLDAGPGPDASADGAAPRDAPADVLDAAPDVITPPDAAPDATLDVAAPPDVPRDVGADVVPPDAARDAAPPDVPRDAADDVTAPGDAVADVVADVSAPDVAEDDAPGDAAAPVDAAAPDAPHEDATPDVPADGDRDDAAPREDAAVDGPGGDASEDVAADAGPPSVPASCDCDARPRPSGGGAALAGIALLGVVRRRGRRGPAAVSRRTIS